MEASPAMIVEGRRLGKLPPKFDKRTLRAENYINPRKLPKIPKTVDRMGRVLKTGMFPVLANNRIGDCTCAAIDHINLSSDIWGKKTLISEQDREARVIARYSRVAGYNPDTGANDDGANLLDVLKDVQANGFDGQRQEPIGPYIAIDPQDDRQLVACLFLFGTLYTGIALPQSAQAETGKIWKTTTGPGSEAGSWGLHAIFLGRITTKECTCVTWGQPQKMTVDWQGRYMDEAWAFLDMDFLRADKKTVSGLDLGGLLADMNELRNA